MNRGVAELVGTHYVKTLTRKPDNNALPQEIKLMVDLSHPNLVKMLEYTLLPKAFKVKMINHGLDISKSSLTFTDLQRLVCQITAVLIYMHENNVVHCDIKPRNIVLNANGNFTLIDLGSAIYGTDSSVSSYTLSYTAPEVLAGKDITNPKKVDTWGLGVTILEKALGNNVFNGGTAKTVLRNIFNYMVLSTEDVAYLGLETLAKKGVNRTCLIPQFYDKYEQNTNTRIRLDLLRLVVIDMLVVNPEKRPLISEIQQNENYKKLISLQ